MRKEILRELLPGSFVTFIGSTNREVPGPLVKVRNLNCKAMLVKLSDPGQEDIFGFELKVSYYNLSCDAIEKAKAVVKRLDTTNNSDYYDGLPF